MVEHMSVVIRSLISGILVGMLTNRAVFLDFSKQTKTTSSSSSVIASLLRKSLRLPIEVDLSVIIDPEDAAKLTRLTLRLSDLSENRNGIVDSLLCHPLMELNDVKVLEIDAWSLSSSSVSSFSHTNLIPLLLRNSHLQPTFNDWFGTDHQHVYKLIADYFLHLSPRLQARLHQLLLSPPYQLPSPVRGERTRGGAALEAATHQWLIGIDMRLARYPLNDIDIAKLSECVARVLPRSGDLLRADNYECITLSVIVDSPTAAVYATQLLHSLRSLNVPAPLPLPLCLMQLQFPVNSTARHDSSTQLQLKSSLSEGALLDDWLVEWWLLQRTNTLIMSPHSFHGEHAMSLHGKPAYLVLPFSRSSSESESSSVKPPYPLRYLHGVTGGESDTCMRTHTSSPSFADLTSILSKASCYHPDMFTVQL